jgi:hypothetical protein
MKVLLVSHPRWFPGNEVVTRDNPEVVGERGAMGIMGKRLWRYARRIRQLVPL